MLSTLGRLFGSKKTIDNIMDKDNGLLRGFGNWIDDMSHTEAEKAEANAAKREWGIRQLEALAPFKVVQRILAFAATALWIFAGVNVIGAIWYDSVFGTDVTTDMLSFASSDYVFWPVMVVFALYFSGGVVDSFRRNKKE